MFRPCTLCRVETTYSTLDYSGKTSGMLQQSEPQGKCNNEVKVCNFYPCRWTYADMGLYKAMWVFVGIQPPKCHMSHQG